MTTTSEHARGKHPDFPLAVYLWGALGVLSAHWLSLHLYELLADPGGWNESPGRLVLFCAPLAFLLGGLLWRLHHRFLRNRTLGQSVAYYTCAFFLVAAAGWLAAASHHWLLHGRFHLAAHPLFFAVLAAVLLAVSWFFHSRLRADYEQVEDIHPAALAPWRNLSPEATQDPIAVSHVLAAGCRALFLFVSTPNIIPRVTGFVQETDPAAVAPTASAALPDAPVPALPHAIIEDGGKKCPLDGGAENLGTDIDAITRSNIFWNWQQLLRALRGMPSLEVVYLLGSPDSPDYQPAPLDAAGRRPEFQPGFKQKAGGGKGSYDYLNLCRAFLAAYLPARTAERTPVVIPWAEPIDFENFNALTGELRKINTSLHAQKLRPSEVLVDVTGGQKVTSIAGAVLTLNNELRFQYVQTNRPFHTLPYDLTRRTAPNLEPHVGG